MAGLGGGWSGRSGGTVGVARARRHATTREETIVPDETRETHSHTPWSDSLSDFVENSLSRLLTPPHPAPLSTWLKSNLRHPGRRTSVLLTLEIIEMILIVR